MFYRKLNKFNIGFVKIILAVQSFPITSHEDNFNLNRPSVLMCHFTYKLFYYKKAHHLYLLGTNSANVVRCKIE